MLSFYLRSLGHGFIFNAYQTNNKKKYANSFDIINFFHFIQVIQLLLLTVCPLNFKLIASDVKNNSTPRYTKEC